MTEVSSGFGGLSGLSRTGVNLMSTTDRSFFCFFNHKIDTLSGGSPVWRRLGDNQDNPSNPDETSVIDAGDARRQVSPMSTSTSSTDRSAAPSPPRTVSRAAVRAALSDSGLSIHRLIRLSIADESTQRKAPPAATSRFASRLSVCSGPMITGAPNAA